MNWTKTPPTEPGWYYYNEMEECIPIEVWKDMSGRLSVGNGDNIKRVKDCLGEWGGRVPEPGTTWNVDNALKAVDDEPEYPGKMPREMEEILRAAIQHSDVDLLVETLRISVRLTKEGIRNRIATTERNRKEQE